MVRRIAGISKLARKPLILLVLAGLSASSAAANPFIAAGRSPSEILAEAAASCMDFGDNVTESSGSMLVCEAPAKNTAAAAFFGSLLYGARGGAVKTVYRYVALPHPEGSRVRVQITLEADQGNGNTKRVDQTDAWKDQLKQTISKLKLIPEADYAPARPSASTDRAE